MNSNGQNFNTNLKIAIIGAGPAGLAAIRHCSDENVECVAFEQTGKIGGIWNYEENSHIDENGLPVHSPMYKGLITNLPKELMEFEDFHYPDKEQSFIPQEEVLEYVQKYAECFNLLAYVKIIRVEKKLTQLANMLARSLMSREMKNIIGPMCEPWGTPDVTFYHQVLLIDPLPNQKWSVKVRNVKTDEITVDTYDGVLVCNGHNYTPFYPVIPGMDHFNGKSLHSHHYRTTDKYKGKRVLIVGAGPSGVDICRLVIDVAEKVYISFTMGARLYLEWRIPEIAVRKPRVAYFKNNIANFEDKTEKEFDEVIYCTGYKYAFEFLSEKCQITVDEDWVKPLYKHLINIEHPSMALVSMTNGSCPFPIFGIQIRFYLALQKGNFHVSKEDMYEDVKNDRAHRKQKGWVLQKLAHRLGPDQLTYCEDLAQTANIKRIPRVIGKTFMYVVANKSPRINYKILNDEEFEVLPLKVV